MKTFLEPSHLYPSLRGHQVTRAKRAANPVAAAKTSGARRKFSKDVMLRRNVFSGEVIDFLLFVEERS